MRLEIELDSDGSHVSGWLRGPDRGVHPFEGRLQLIAALEIFLSSPAPPTQPPDPARHRNRSDR
jgi:hypothetical protein